MRNLAELYGLSPATMAGLADIKGTQPGELVAPTADAVGAYVPQAAEAAAVQGNPVVQQAKDILNTQPVQDISKRAENIGRAFAGTGAFGPAGLLVKPPPPDAAAPGAANDTSPQGPATDGFPTVKTDYGGSQSAGAMPSSPGVFRPAGWSHSTAKESREGNVLDPTALEAMGVARDSAAGHGLLAADNRHQAATIDAEADLEAAKARLHANQLGRERLAEIQGQKEAFVSDQLRTLQNLSTQARAKVNPDQIWEQRGTAGRVMAALAIGLGQFGALMRGGENTAWKIIQHSIDTNIDAQKQSIANAKDAYQLQSNLYAQNLQVFGDKERAALATRVNYLDQVQNMLDMKRAEAKGNIADASYHEMQQKVQNERANTEKEFLDLTKVKSTQELSDKWRDAAMVGGTGGDKGHSGLYVPTLGGYARSEQDARELNRKGALRMQMTENMREIYNLMDKAKGLNSATSPMELRDIDKRIQSLVNDTLTKNTVIEGQGAMSKSDQEVAAAAKSLGDLKVQGVPNGVIARDQARVKDSAARILKHHRIEGEAYKIQVGSEEYQRGPHGPEPVRVLEGRNKTLSKNTEGYDDLVSPPKGVPQK